MRIVTDRKEAEKIWDDFMLPLLIPDVLPERTPLSENSYLVVEDDKDGNVVCASAFPYFASGRWSGWIIAAAESFRGKDVVDHCQACLEYLYTKTPVVMVRTFIPTAVRQNRVISQSLDGFRGFETVEGGWEAKWTIGGWAKKRGLENVRNIPGIAMKRVERAARKVFIRDEKARVAKKKADLEAARADMLRKAIEVDAKREERQATKMKKEVRNV